jgi:hypothetical protein
MSSHGVPPIVDALPHGFRASFRDWCAERTKHRRDVALPSDLTRTWTLQSTTRLNARSTFKAWVPFRVGADQARLCATIDTSAAAAAAATAANEDWRFADEVVIASAWPSITAVSPTR